ncbi:peptidoglycan DD-metalloendopeptidase family protein [Rossellomorea marisflavi]|uniref:peptidoglycan DD-metalloendopeptidase family protein n=1 Tax=Rossellomorea marisflavi TaxID=189381 RepID=UPI003FA04774
MKKQALALLIGGAILTQPLMPVLSVHAESHTTDKKDSKVDKKGDKKENKKPSKYQVKIKKKQEEILAMDKEMIVLRHDIKELNEGLKKESLLKKKKLELAESEKALKERWEGFSNRLSEWQVKGTPEENFVDVIFGAESLGDLINRTFTFKTLVDADNKQMKSLQEATDALQAEKDALELELQKMREEKKTLSEKQAKLKEKKKEMKKELDTLKDKELKRIQAELKKQEELKKQMLEKQLRDKQKLDAEMAEKALRELRSLSTDSNTDVDTDISDMVTLQSDVLFLKPTDGRLTSPYGNRQNPTGAGIEFHTGIDLANANGTPVMATADGVVVQVVSSNAGYGNHFKVKHEIQGKTFYSLYAHLSVIGVQMGEEVKQGEIIGLMGSTGRSTGPHLHFEIQDSNQQHMNPESFIGKKADKPADKEVKKKTKSTKAKKEAVQ